MKVIVVILSLLFFSSCEEIHPLIVLKGSDSLQLKKGILLHNKNPFTGNIVDYNPQKQISYTCSYTNGKKQGEEKKWYDSGVLEMERFYVDGMKTGIHKGWWENKHPKFEYHFNTEGAYEGAVTEWFQDGTLFKEFHYKAGKEEGSQKMFKFDGSIRANYVVKNGERFGLIGLKKCDAVSTM